MTAGPGDGGQGTAARSAAPSAEDIQVPVPGRSRLPVWALGISEAYIKIAPVVGVALLGLFVVRLVLMTSQAATMEGAIGIDYRAVVDAAVRWLNGGSPYLERQLHGPYDHLGWNTADTGEFLYPPVSLPIFAAFSVLPPAAWWVGWATLLVVGIFILRPGRAWWPVLGLLAATTTFVPVIIAGNPVLWISLAALFGPILGWPGPLVLMKPSLAPFALLGMASRSWWLSLAVIAVCCVPFGTLWVDWYHAVTDLRAEGILFSLGQVPIMLIPLVIIIGARPRGGLRLIPIRPRMPGAWRPVKSS